MATASIERGMLWTDLEGRELPGGWRLRRLMRPEGRNAWFEATGPDGNPAIVSLTETLNDEEELLARLRAAAVIRHPNVVTVRDARLVWMSDTPIVLAAMEATEENLAEVLRERALEPSEARPLLNSLLNGLAAIHARRLTHGRVEAGSVLATGDTVKLRSDCLHLEGFATGAAEDVRGVGRVVTQALTRRIPANENDPVLQLVPEPMGRAVRRALSGNATVEEVAALAGVRLVKASEMVVPRTPAEPMRVAGSVLSAIRKPQEVKAGEGGAAGAEKRPAPMLADLRAVEVIPAAKPGAGQMDLPLIPRWKEETDAVDEEELNDEDRTLTNFLAGMRERLGRFMHWMRGLPGNWNYHRRGALWVVGAAVGLVLATGLLLYGWLHRGPAVKVAVAQPRIVVARAEPLHATAPRMRAAEAPVWRVVVYTYRRRSDAEQRARDLGQRYPQLHPGVMATRGGDFLVTLGGEMSRDQAIALRVRAVREGLPGDTYAQNFDHQKSHS